MRKAIRQAFLTETTDNYETLADGWRRYNYLAISGGGSDGAFGAGILNGWSAKDNRPAFKVVTGVSTGALIAPFAFLGPAYDPQIKEAYTTVNPGRIYVVRQLIAILWEESVADNKPLKELVTRYITPDVLDAIAVEHAKGRRLYVASTNMDREEPVIWDMGAIASSKDKDKLELFRSVLVASASIPAIFPPTLVEVDLDGKPYDELHCDGGVFFQSFFIGAIVDLPALIREAHPDYQGRVFQDLYVIRNGSTTPNRKQIPRGLRSISGRAIGTMLKVSGINDLYRLFLSTEHDTVDFYFVSLPVDYVRTTDEEFNEAEMNRQYQLGYELGAGGVPWRRLPPGYVLKDQDTTIAEQPAALKEGDMTDLLKPDDLRKIADDLDMAKAKKMLEHMKVEEAERDKLREAFNSRDIHPQVKERVNAAIRRAAEQGNRQLLALTFPASYCNDQGRRINNMEPDWPQSLEGFAKKAYEYFMAELKPLGFRLSAQVMDYPGGMPGTVGLYLSWDR